MAVSVACVWLLLRDTDLAQLATAVRRVNPLLLPVAVLSVVLTFLAKAARWRLLFREREVPSLGRSFAIICIGLLVNSFAPARLGEVVRALLMGGGNRNSYAFGTIVVEKVADLVMFALGIALVLSQHTLPEWLVQPARVTVILMLLGVSACIALAWWGGLALRLLTPAARVLPAGWGAWLARQAGEGLASLRVLRRPRLVIGLLLWSGVVWTLGASTNYLMIRGMGLQVPASAALLLLVVLQAGVAVPSSPGKIGVFHYLVVVTLALLGVEREEALGYAVVLHLSVYLTIIALGVWYLWREEVSWRQFLPWTRLKSAAGKGL